MYTTDWNCHVVHYWLGSVLNHCTHSNISVFWPPCLYFVNIFRLFPVYTSIIAALRLHAINAWNQKNVFSSVHADRSEGKMQWESSAYHKQRTKFDDVGDPTSNGSLFVQTIINHPSYHLYTKLSWKGCHIKHLIYLNVVCIIAK